MFRFIEKLGEGNNIVCLVEDGNHKSYAMKRIKFIEKNVPKCIHQEIDILKKLKSDNNIITYIDHYIHKNSVYIRMEYAEFTLESCLYKHTSISLENLSNEILNSIFGQIVHGLYFCHTNCILHRDLKPENILVCLNGCVKIADFGLSIDLKDCKNKKFENEVITLWYRPPELLLGSEKYSYEVDIWSLGCIYYELKYLNKLFVSQQNSIESQYEKITELLGIPTADNLNNMQLSKRKRRNFKSEKTTTIINTNFDTWIQ